MAPREGPSVRLRLRGVLMSAARLLPSLRELYSRLPEAYHLERWGTSARPLQPRLQPRLHR
jgi:hypothetical protein